MPRVVQTVASWTSSRPVTAVATVSEYATRISSPCHRLKLPSASALSRSSRSSSISHHSWRSPAYHQRTIPSFLSSLSRATTALVSEDDDDEGESSTDETRQRTEDLQQQRPRLHALRASLATEPTLLSPKSVQSVSSWNSERSNANAMDSATAAATTTTSSPAAATSTANLEALRERLALLPDPTNVLMDQHNRHHSYLRLSLTERCNLRCTYCMPEQGVPLQPSSQLLSTLELLHIARLFAKAGVRKWRLTGGEPTLRADLVDIVAGLHEISENQPTNATTESNLKRSIGITTNGIVLAGKLPDLVAAGLTSVNISLDTLDPTKFATLTRRPATYLDRVWQSIDAAMTLATRDSTNLTVKLNCVVMRGVNDCEIPQFIRLAQTYPGLQVRFIEYMPFADNGWDWSKCVPYQEILDNLNADADESVHLQAVKSDDPHDTTKWYTTGNNENASTGARQRNVGFITSMSEHFCASCNRLRITADGTIKVCLFDGRSDATTSIVGNGLVSLRDAVRAHWTEPELYKLIHATVQTKHAKFGGHADPKDISMHADQNRPMTLIGG